MTCALVCLKNPQRLEKFAMKETASIERVIPLTDVVKRAARIGVEIRNVKLSGDLPSQTIAAINSLLLEHKVIFFRDQGHLDDAEQERFAACLGRLVPHPTLGTINGTTSIIELDSARGGSRADVWHADGTFLAAYPKLAVLRAVVIPSSGGDTIWSNAVATIWICRGRSNGLPTSSGPFTATPSTTPGPAVFAKSTRSILMRSLPKQSMRPSIRWSVYIPRPASVRWCSAMWCKGLLISQSATVRGCSIYSSPISRRPKTPYAGAGKKAMSRFGITAQRSIMRSTITVTSIASFIVPQSMVTRPSASTVDAV